MLSQVAGRAGELADVYAGSFEVLTQFITPVQEESFLLRQHLALLPAQRDSMHGNVRESFLAVYGSAQPRTQPRIGCWVLTGRALV